MQKLEAMTAIQPSVGNLTRLIAYTNGSPVPLTLSFQACFVHKLDVLAVAFSELCTLPLSIFKSFRTD
jgi:hypothetical protein